MMNLKRDIEILAPCGSYEILIAAIHAGADACYIGGNRFGARAYAENFDEESIIQAINYAHIHGVKIYLTVNTLLKDQEIQELYSYLLPFYEAGLDAVIVQDVGVFRVIRQWFPDLPIHCSTQMNITSLHAAKMMKKMGATRVVTAREMSIAEIKELHNQVDIEIETFVHGAMCYSYSGQCLMSSLAGGRSGNRGRCAQPCRKCYDGDYVLSLKDMCTLEHIPALIDAGVYSLKIEGRMKNAYYVASAVHAYREVVDLYFADQLTNQRIKELRFELANVFNRGNFSDGYMRRHNAFDMISIYRPNNQGVLIGEVIGIQGGAVKLKLQEQLYKQDILEIPCKNGDIIEITTGIDGRIGQAVLVNCPKTKTVKIGGKVYRTRCNQLLAHIEQDYIEAYKKIKLQGKLTASLNESLRLELRANIDKHIFTGDASLGLVERANNKIHDIDSIRKPLLQLGNTDYELIELELCVDEDAFVPKGLLKQLRREAIDALETNIISFYQRKAIGGENVLLPYTYSEAKPLDKTVQPTIFAAANLEQLDVILSTIDDKNDNISLMLSPKLYKQSLKSSERKNVLTKHCNYYLDLPFVISSSFKLSEYLQMQNYSGIYIRNIDGLGAVLQSDVPRDCHLILAASLYCYNGYAYDFYRELCNEFKNLTYEMPRELQLTELRGLSDTGDMDMLIYEYQPVMITANCLQKTKFGCDHSENIIKITDDRSNVFYGAMHCEACINVIYNGLPYDIMNHMDSIYDNHIQYQRGIVRFTIEDKEQVKQVLKKMNGADVQYKTTTGHLFRGVE